MKIVIVTVYNSMNSGSYLQAKALYDVLGEQYGKEVYFLETGARNLFKTTLVYCLKKLCHFKFKLVVQRFRMYREFTKCVSRLNTVSYKELDLDKDVFVLGSDEIWNVKSSGMIQFPVFWGKGLPGNRTISYAPSINRTTQEDFSKYPFVLELFEKIDSVSVRDEYSKKTLETVTNRKIELVCDPTNLVPVENFINQLEPCTDSQYVLLYYSPDHIKDDEKKQILEFCRINNKKLISFSFDVDWCDKVVSGSPYMFLSYIYHADYVFTATFHGATFSILFEKKFVIFDKTNIKVQELLNTYGVTDRMYGESPLSVSEIALSGYNNQEIRSKISNLREHSLNYLKESISEIQLRNK